MPTGDEKISEMPTASALDGTELVPLIQGGDNVQTSILVLTGAAYRSASAVPVPEGTQPVNFSSEFVAVYSLMLQAWDSTGSAIQVNLVSRDKHGFVIYAPMDILLDYEAKIPK